MPNTAIAARTCRAEAHFESSAVLPWALVLAIVLALPACTTQRLTQLNQRLGLDHGDSLAASPPPVLPQGLAQLYAQGAQALLANDSDGAINAWRQFMAQGAADLPLARKVRGYLTLLERDSARRFAQRAALGEKGAGYAQPAGAGNRLHVAVFPFDMQGPDPARKPASTFNRAAVALIMADLAQVPSLTLLEREKIDALIQETTLWKSGLVDAASIGTPARLLGAGTVIAGAVYSVPGLDGPGSGRYKINSAVSSVADGKLVATQEVDGSQSEFYRLEKRIVYGILKALKVTDIPPAVRKIHTRNWSAYARFATGLSLQAEGRFAEARQAFYAALQFDPDFGLAEQAYLDMPVKATSVDDVRAELRSPER